MSSSGEEFDRFGDVINGNNGIFGSDTAAMEQGLVNFDTARTVATAQGVVVEMACRGCGRGVKLTIEYPELVAVKYNVAPHIAFQGQPNILQNPVPWAYSPREQAWWPHYPCNHCRTPCAPLMTPEEAEGHLAKARRNRWIDTAGEQYVAGIASRAAAAQQQQAAARR